jgi:hypothetical protein
MFYLIRGVYFFLILLFATLLVPVLDDPPPETCSYLFGPAVGRFFGQFEFPQGTLLPQFLIA